MKITFSSAVSMAVCTCAGLDSLYFTTLVSADLPPSKGIKHQEHILAHFPEVIVTKHRRRTQPCQYFALPDDVLHP